MELPPPTTCLQPSADRLISSDRCPPDPASCCSAQVQRRFTTASTGCISSNVQCAAVDARSSFPSRCTKRFTSLGSAHPLLRLNCSWRLRSTVASSHSTITCCVSLLPARLTWTSTPSLATYGTVTPQAWRSALFPHVETTGKPARARMPRRRFGPAGAPGDQGCAQGAARHQLGKRERCPARAARAVAAPPVLLCEEEDALINSPNPSEAVVPSLTQLW